MDGVSTFKRLCSEPLDTYFPFPLALEGKKAEKKGTIYVVPHMEEEKRYVEHTISLKNTFKVKSIRHLRLDAANGELVIYSDSDGTHLKKKAKEIVKAEIGTEKNSVRLELLSEEPVIFWAKDSKRCSSIIQDINVFLEPLHKAKKQKDRKKKKDKKDVDQKTKKDKKEEKEKKEKEEKPKVAENTSTTDADADADASASSQPTPTPTRPAPSPTASPESTATANVVPPRRPPKPVKESNSTSIAKPEITTVRKEQIETGTAVEEL